MKAELINRLREAGYVMIADFLWYRDNLDLEKRVERALHREYFSTSDVSHVLKISKQDARNAFGNVTPYGAIIVGKPAQITLDRVEKYIKENKQKLPVR